MATRKTAQGGIDLYEISQWVKQAMEDATTQMRAELRSLVDEAIRDHVSRYHAAPPQFPAAWVVRIREGARASIDEQLHRYRREVDASVARVARAEARRVLRTPKMHPRGKTRRAR